VSALRRIRERHRFYARDELGTSYRICEAVEEIFIPDPFEGGRWVEDIIAYWTDEGCAASKIGPHEFEIHDMPPVIVRRACP
jgi:hypothetical protein